MIEVKIFEDGKQVKQLEGEVIFAMAVTDSGEDSMRVQSTLRGEANLNELFDSMAFSCAKHLVSLSASETEGCKAVIAFANNATIYGVERLEKKYREEKEDGQP